MFEKLREKLTILWITYMKRGEFKGKMIYRYKNHSETVFLFTSNFEWLAQTTIFNTLIMQDILFKKYSELVRNRVFLHELGHKRVPWILSILYFFAILLLFILGCFFLLEIKIIKSFMFFSIFILFFRISEINAELFAISNLGKEKFIESLEELSKKRETDKVLYKVYYLIIKLLYPSHKTVLYVHKNLNKLNYLMRTMKRFKISKELLHMVITINLALAFIVPLFLTSYFEPTISEDAFGNLSVMRNKMRDIFKWVLITSCIAFILTPIVDEVQKDKNSSTDNKKALLAIIEFLTVLIVLCLTFHNMYKSYSFVYDLSAIQFVVTSSNVMHIGTNLKVTQIHLPDEVFRRFCDSLSKDEIKKIPIKDAFVSCLGSLPANKSISIIKNESGLCKKIIPEC